MARLEFDCDTVGCGNVVHTEVPIDEHMHREARCTNCGAVFHARGIVYREEGQMLGYVKPEVGPEDEEEEESEEESHEEEPHGEEHESVGNEPVPAEG